MPFRRFTAIPRLMDIFDELDQLRESGSSFVMATIVRTKGSSPREAGAKMLVLPDGSIRGTIGGGNFEKTVIEESLSLFEGDRTSSLKHFRFAQSGPDSTEMCCGGEAEVFMERYGKPKQLIVFGGGHVGSALVRLASDSVFKITVVDDRRETLDQFSSGVTTILTDAEYQTCLPELDSDCFVVIVTRLHKIDRDVLERVLQQDAAYVGMIGSKAKVVKLFKSLEDSGITKETLSTVHAPIGLDIGAEGPYEIAVAIMAELLSTLKKTPQK